MVSERNAATRRQYRRMCADCLRARHSQCLDERCVCRVINDCQNKPLTEAELRLRFRAIYEAVRGAGR